MQKVQDQLDFPVDTPSDEKMRRHFELDPQQPTPDYGERYSKHANNKQPAANRDARRKKRRKAARNARKRQRA